MKKLFVIILGIVFMIPITVKADMGPPQIREYKATPKSVDGAKYYNGIYEMNSKKGTFSYNTVLTISEETKVNSKVYAYACDKNNCGYVLLSDLKLSEKPNDLDGYEAKYVGRVFAKKGVDVYEGPGYIYEKTGDRIPANADIVVSGYDNNEGTWLKVKYGKITGYVDSDDAAVMVLYNGLALIQGSNKTVKEFYKSNAWDRKIAYKENDEYIIVDELYEFNGEFKYTKTEFKATKELDLYKKFEYSESRETVGTIKKGDTVKFIYDASYQGTASYYVEVNGKKGWIETDYQEIDSYFEGFNYDKINDYRYDNKLYLNNKPVEAKKGESDDHVTPEKKEDKKYNWFTKENIIILSSFGAVLIVLTAIVTMLLVNKKGKKSVQD